VKPRILRRRAAPRGARTLLCLLLLGCAGARAQAPPEAAPGLCNFRRAYSGSDLPGQLTALQLCAGEPELMAFERRYRRRAELWIRSAGASPLRVVTRPQEAPASSAWILDSAPESSEGQLRWHPGEPVEGERWFVCVGTGGEENVDLYLGAYPSGRSFRLTQHPGNDFMPAWSPDGDALVFVSGRTGNADLFLLTGLNDVIRGSGTAIAQREPRQLTVSPGEDLYPVWSPDGRYIAYTAHGMGPRETGSRENDGIMILPARAEMGEAIRVTHDAAAAEFRPSWAPDMSLIAYYVQSDEVYHDAETPADREVHLAVSQLERCVEDGRIMGGRRLWGVTRYLASSVVPDISEGPLWLGADPPALLYVRRSAGEGDLLCRASVSRWLSPGSDFEVILESGLALKTSVSLLPGHRIGVCSGSGNDWEIWVGEIDGAARVLPGEHPIAPYSLPCPSTSTRSRHASWLRTLILASLAAALGYAWGYAAH